MQLWLASGDVLDLLDLLDHERFHAALGNQTPAAFYEGLVLAAA